MLLILSHKRLYYPNELKLQYFHQVYESNYFNFCSLIRKDLVLKLIHQVTCTYTANPIDKKHLNPNSEIMSLPEKYHRLSKFKLLKYLRNFLTNLLKLMIKVIYSNLKGLQLSFLI